MRSSTPRRAASAGFTLIEILVALLILGIMSALGYGAYRAARISGERTEESLQRSREIEFGMHVLVQDFSEAVPRPVRDILGQSQLPALRGTQGAGVVSNPGGTGSGLGANSSMQFDSGAGFNSSNGYGANQLASSSSGFGTANGSSVPSILDVTRAGWSNTAGQQRGTLQRVSYALVDGVLKRSYTMNLDTVLGTKPVVQDLLTGVKGIQFRYLDVNQSWQSQWPLSSSTSDLQTRPVAVEVVIEFKDWGRVRRLVEVAG
jgi:prepilin-type N-terminal cleavage/methylation domain-containing protein